MSLHFAWYHGRHVSYADSGANDSGHESGAELSTHERRQHKIAAQIAQIEEDAMKERSWYLRGEATAATRPKDSALEIDVVRPRARLASHRTVGNY